MYFYGLKIHNLCIFQSHWSHWAQSPLLRPSLHSFSHSPNPWIIGSIPWSSRLSSSLMVLPWQSKFTHSFNMSKPLSIPFYQFYNWILLNFLPYYNFLFYLSYSLLHCSTSHFWSLYFYFIFPSLLPSLSMLI